MSVLYSLTASFDDEATREEWLRWMDAEHVNDLKAGGALTAIVTRRDGEPLRCDIHYRFASRETLERYFREFAPALRAKGAAKFPGVKYERTTGVIVLSR